MSTTPSIPGVDRDALAEAILRDAIRNRWMPASSADAVLAYIAAHHECPVLPSGTSPTVLRLAAGDIRGMHLGFGGLPRSLPGTLDALADALEGAGPPPAPPACDREHADEWVPWPDEVEMKDPRWQGVMVRAKSSEGSVSIEGPLSGWDSFSAFRLGDEEWMISLVGEFSFFLRPDDARRMTEECAPEPERRDHRDDLPDGPRAFISRELGAVWAEAFLGLLDEHGWTVTRKEER